MGSGTLNGLKILIVIKCFEPKNQCYYLRCSYRTNFWRERLPRWELHSGKVLYNGGAKIIETGILISENILLKNALRIPSKPDTQKNEFTISFSDFLIFPKPIVGGAV